MVLYTQFRKYKLLIGGERMSEKDYAKLRGRAVEMGLSQKDIAQQIGISGTTYSLKINGRYPFKQSEIQKIVNLLSIPADEIGTYFFTQKVQKK